uniref:Uncharacterized protein n=1 Tax=Spongospora subterranea TaxID=70186 RepID=A0A0H5RCG2_9EUKA|eukprot:CRZ11935.1 hypothetical protein [Spongospora subterranea]
MATSMASCCCLKRLLHIVINNGSPSPLVNGVTANTGKFLACIMNRRPERAYKAPRSKKKKSVVQEDDATQLSYSDHSCLVRYFKERQCGWREEQSKARFDIQSGGI